MRVYKPGTLLPSEHDLCILYHVTRPTIRKALDALVNEGYIKKHQGKGSVVMGVPKGIGILSIAGTTSAIGQHNLKTRIIVKPEVRTLDQCIYIQSDRTREGTGLHLHGTAAVRQ